MRSTAFGSELAWWGIGGTPMGRGFGVGALLACLLAPATVAEAQWNDPKLIAGQVAFHTAVSFVAKLIHHEPPGRAIREALESGTLAGGLSHAGYCIAGRNPEWALVGKALAQKGSLTTRRSVDGLPVFDRSLATHWEITHSFVHFEWNGKPHVEIDAINAAFSAYYLAAGEPYEFDAKRTLLSGSLVFRNHAPPPRLLGYYVPGVVWIDSERLDDQHVWGHELVHSLQAERGSAIRDWRYGPLRFNWLVLTSGVPALFAGWPDHDRRLHELEAEGYSLPR
jgi:hypothetical protein